MAFTIIVIAVEALIENLILYYVGTMLTRPKELRNFLGLDDKALEKDEKISSLIKNTGHLIQLSAVINALVTILNPLLRLFEPLQ